MLRTHHFWESVWKKAVSPKIDPGELERRLREVKEKLPPPVIWLLGKAQSGKTSLVQSLTGSSRAEIGNGFRPCTRSSRLYSFPDEEGCILKFLDTRGLGEVDYDPAEDIQRCEDQAHLLIVVIKATDHAQQCALEPLKAILKRHSQWPVLVVQTALHEGYPSSTMQHVLPYPFAEFPFPATVPHDLARSLSAQRKMFADYRVRFVPVDLTQPEDGLEPTDYGLDALWQAVEDALPLGLRGMLYQAPTVRQALRDEYFRAAHAHVVTYALLAGGAAAFPVPIVDVPLVLIIQAKMFHSVASVYQQPMDTRRMAEFCSTIGLGLTRLLVRELLKMVPVPGLGVGISAVYAAASTYALGMALCGYFSRVRGGDVPDTKVIRSLYTEEFHRGKLWLGERFKHNMHGRGQSK